MALPSLDMGSHTADSWQVRNLPERHRRTRLEESSHQLGAVAFWALGNAFPKRGRELWLMERVGRDWSGVSDAAGRLIEKHSATSTEGLGLAERWTSSQSCRSGVSTRGWATSSGALKFYFKKFYFKKQLASSAPSKLGDSAPDEASVRPDPIEMPDAS